MFHHFYQGMVFPLQYLRIHIPIPEPVRLCQFQTFKDVVKSSINRSNRCIALLAVTLYLSNQFPEIEIASGLDSVRYCSSCPSISRFWAFKHVSTRTITGNNHLEGMTSFYQFILPASSPNPLSILKMYHRINIPHAMHTITFPILMHRAVYQVNACHIKCNGIARGNNANIP